MLSTLGARSFYAAAPTLWNSPSANVREITSLSIFKKNLKTPLFNLALQRVTFLGVVNCVFFALGFIDIFLTIHYSYCFCIYIFKFM